MHPVLKEFVGAPPLVSTRQPGRLFPLSMLRVFYLTTALINMLLWLRWWHVGRIFAKDQKSKEAD